MLQGGKSRSLGTKNGSAKNDKVPNHKAGLHVPCPAPAQCPA